MVKDYLLLRNNKQLGPFSQEELILQRLRPHDLIWIEGRSAAWQYAVEIASLKSYVDQSGIEKHQEFPSKIKVQSTAFPTQSQPSTNEAHKAYLPPDKPTSAEDGQPSAPKKVFVSLPANSHAKKVATPTTPPTTNKLNQDASSEQRRSVADTSNNSSQLISESSDVNRSTPKSKPEFDAAVKEKLVTKYSSSLEEKEEEFTKWIYEKKTRKSGLAPEWIGGIAVVVLLFMGTAAYLVKNHAGNSTESKEIVAAETRDSEELVTTVPPTETPAPIVPADEERLSQPAATGGYAIAAKTSAPAKAARIPESPSNKKNNVLLVSKKTTPQLISKPTEEARLKTVIAAPAPIPNKTVTAPQVEKTVSNPVKETTASTPDSKAKKTFSEKVDGFFNRVIHAKKVEPVAPAAGQPESPATDGQRKASHRADSQSPADESPKKDLASGMHITTIEANNNWMQGVHGLRMKIENNNDVKISNAAVEVRYLNEQNAVLEKKTIRINDIPAGKSVIMSIPDHRLADHAETSLISAGN